MSQTRYEEALKQLEESPTTWLVTGVAGFIGSNLLETLLKLNQRVMGLDNFSTGHKRNLDDVQRCVSPDQWSRFRFYQGDIRNLADCRLAVDGVDHVLHQAALGSVPRSIADPIASNESNVTGFLNMLVASKDARVASFTYAASSSTYGDHPDLPKVEDKIGRPLSPYAVTKYVNELYAEVFSRTYGFSSIGLRYFNVFGPRQDPKGAYAAVIPKWITQLMKGEVVNINGDGETSRDFCYIENVVQANILAATSILASRNQVYNVALGEQTSLNRLFKMIFDELKNSALVNSDSDFRNHCVYMGFRTGDVRHSLASLDKLQKYLSYQPSIRLESGLKKTVNWFSQNDQ